MGDCWIYFTISVDHVDQLRFEANVLSHPGPTALHFSLLQLELGQLDVLVVSGHFTSQPFFIRES